VNGVGEDLWDVINRKNTISSTNESGNADALKRWKQLNIKVEFVLKQSISTACRCTQKMEAIEYKRGVRFEIVNFYRVPF